VGALLVINAVLSFMQERRAAGRETLRKRLQVSARVRRDSSWQVIPPGMSWRHRSRAPGDIIPADVNSHRRVERRPVGTHRRIERRDRSRRSASSGPSSVAAKATRGDADGAKTTLAVHELVQKARPKLNRAVVAKVVRCSSSLSARYA